MRRDGAMLKAEIRPETVGEALEGEKVFRNTIAAEGWYRKVARPAR